MGVLFLVTEIVHPFIVHMAKQTSSITTITTNKSIHKFILYIASLSFLPRMLTSIICASFLVVSWFLSLCAIFYC